MKKYESDNITEGKEESESTQLILQDNQDGRRSELSVVKQNVMLVSLLMLHLSVMMADSLLVPFYGTSAKKKGINNIQVGIVLAAYEAARFVSAPIYGIVIQRFGPKGMCFVGSICCGVSIIAFGLVYYVNDSYFFLMCVILRLITGSSSVMLTVAMTSGLMKVTDYKSTTIMGLIEASMGAGFTVGPAIGALFYKSSGYVACFLIFGGFITLASMLIPIVVPKMEPDSASENTGLRGFLCIISIPGVFLAGFLTTSMSKFGTNMIFSFVPEHMNTEYPGEAQTAVTVFYTACPVIYLISTVPVSRIVNKGYVWSLMVVCWLVAATIYICITPYVLHLLSGRIHYEWWYTVIIFGLSELFYTALMIAPFQACLDLVSINGIKRDNLGTYGMLSGIINSGFNFGSTLAPAVAGTITQYLGFAWTSIVATGLYTVMGLMMIGYLCYMRLRSKPLK